jgi:hypothetical protein
MALPDRQDADVQADWSYWQDENAATPEGSQVELVGQLADRAKAEFLRNAAALLFPVRSPEPCFRSARLSRLEWSWSSARRAGRQYWH